MTTLAIAGLMLLSQPPAGAQAKLDATVAPTGVIAELRSGGELVATDVKVLVVKPAWNGMWATQAAADPAKLQTTRQGARTELRGELASEAGPIALTESVEPVAEGVRLRYTLTPSAALTTESVVVSVTLPAPLAAGTAKWFVFAAGDLRSALFPAELPDPYHLVGGAVDWIGWTLASGHGLRFDLAQSTIKSVNLQDDRKWNVPAFELHLPVPDTRELKAGATVRFELLLQPFTLQQAQQEEARAVKAREAEIVHFESAKPLRLGAVKAPATVPQFGRLELSLDLDATYDNPFDPKQIDVQATFTGPGGRKAVVPGFFYVPYERTEVNGQERLHKTGDPVFMVRFTPSTPGRYECVTRATDRSGTVQSKPAAFQVQPKQARGFVRRSEKSPYYLRFDSGEPYFAVGENVCWGGARQTLDYDRWFPHLGAARGNFARLWLVRWNMGLEWSPKDSFIRGRFYGLGRYSPDNAWRLDYVMDLAEKSGIYVMLCLGYHGELLDQRAYFGEQCWDFSPYNKANGGPCEKPAEFWTNPDAREHYKQRLRYYVARWGWCPNVLSFEFWNEVVAPAEWVAEMAAYLRGIDPYRHLLTTTYGTDPVWAIPEIDYTQTHTYGQGDSRRDCVAEIANLCRTHTERFKKPHLVGEFGIDWQKSDTDHDPEGHALNLHNGLWAAMASRSMGGASVWYWDGYVEPLNLYREFTALSRFAEDVPWPELDFKLASVSRPTREARPGEAWSDFEVAPPMGWGKGTGTDFTLATDGTLTGEGAFSSFLYSPGKPSERQTLRFHVTCPQGGKLVLHVGTVSARARLQVLVDGKPAWEKDLRAGPEGTGEYKSTKWLEQWKLWQSVFDADYSVDIPPGEHTLEPVNAEGDWAEVTRYRFVGCVDPRFVSTLDVLGLQTRDLAILWLHNQASNWYTRTKKLPIEPISGASFQLKGLADGEYLIQWYDTRTGERTRQERARCQAGILTLTPGEIASDVACKVRRP